MRYLFGLLLSGLIAFVYNATRHDDPRHIVRDGLIVFGYVVASMLALAVVVYALCELK